jgi:hypothetical protein
MKLLAILRPGDGGAVRAAIAARAPEELRVLWNQYRVGLVREIYSPGGPGAVLIVEADSRDSARSALAELPLLADEIMSLELIELQPFTAIEMLFSPESRR